MSPPAMVPVLGSAGKEFKRESGMARLLGSGAACDQEDTFMVYGLTMVQCRFRWYRRADDLSSRRHDRKEADEQFNKSMALSLSPAEMYRLTTILRSLQSQSSIPSSSNNMLRHRPPPNSPLSSLVWAMRPAIKSCRGYTNMAANLTHGTF